MFGTLADPAHRRIRSEMRALQVGLRFPIPSLLIGLIAAASAASTFLTLTSF